MNKNKSIAVLTLVLGLSLAAVIPNAFASHSPDPQACYNDGTYDGEENPFSQDLYDMCAEGGAEDDYYRGFIEGCMSVEGNDRETCESATDAGDDTSDEDEDEDEEVSADEAEEPIPGVIEAEE